MKKIVYTVGVLSFLFSCTGPVSENPSVKSQNSASVSQPTPSGPQELHPESTSGQKPKDHRTATHATTPDGARPLCPPVDEATPLSSTPGEATSPKSSATPAEKSALPVVLVYFVDRIEPKEAQQVHKAIEERWSQNMRFEEVEKEKFADHIDDYVGRIVLKVDLLRYYSSFQLTIRTVKLAQNAEGTLEEQPLATAPNAGEDHLERLIDVLRAIKEAPGELPTEEKNTASN